MKIFISALGPTISEQCQRAGYVATGMAMDLVDEMSHQLTRAHIHGILTDSEIDRARNRLLKAAKLRQVRAATEVSL